MENNKIKELKELKENLKLLKQKENQNRIHSYLMPISIIIAGVLVAGAVLYSQNNTQQVQAVVAPQQIVSGSSDKVKPITSRDHILGNPDALVKIIEFSDTECPFCKRFHPTMKRIMDEYGKDGRVAWVYRHFPLDSIHSKARLEESATELAANLGGNDKFWEYLNKIFEITPSNDGLDLNLLPQIAQSIGLDRKPFESLVAQNDRKGGVYASHIEDNYRDAIASGGTGTPYSVIIAPNGKTFSLTGAQSYSAVKSIVEFALTQK